MQQAVHREHGVERATEIKVQEVLPEGRETDRPAVPDHRGGQVGADDVEAGVGEEASVHPRSRADLQERVPILVPEQLEERRALGLFPGLTEELARWSTTES